MRTKIHEFRGDTVVVAVGSMVADNSDVNDNFIIHFNVPIWGGEHED